MTVLFGDVCVGALFVLVLMAARKLPSPQAARDIRGYAVFGTAMFALFVAIDATVLLLGGDL